MVEYDENHTRDTYKLCNPETKRVILSRDIKCSQWKNTDPEETMKIFRHLNENDLVSGIEEFVKQDTTPTSDLLTGHR